MNLDFFSAIDCWIVWIFGTAIHESMRKAMWNLFCGIFIGTLINLDAKQLKGSENRDFNQPSLTVIVNAYSLCVMDYCPVNTSIVQYNRDQLLDYRYVPRRNILPSHETLSLLKDLNLLQYRGKRSGQTRSKCRYGVNIENLIHINVNHNLLMNRGKERVVCLTINCRSLVNKSESIGQTVREERADFALLTETWFSDDKQHQFDTSDLNQNGYKISVANRKGRVGGGIALTCRSSVNMRKLSGGTTDSFEFGIWELVLKSITVHVLGIYRSPSVSTPAQFVPEFFEFMEETLPRYSNILVTGDFNLHISDTTNATITEFNNSLCAMGLHQHVNFPTHTAGQCLDLVITEITNGVQLQSCEPGAFVSDHCVVKCILKVQKENIMSKTVEFRNFKNMDHANFSADIAKITIECDDVNSFVERYETEIEAILDSHAPMHKKTIICRDPKPWFNENILQLKRLLRRAERVWRKHRQPDHLNILQSF